LLFPNSALGRGVHGGVGLQGRTEAALVEVETAAALIEEETAAAVVGEPAAVVFVAALDEVQERGGV
jgi:hypothetical protein